MTTQERRLLAEQAARLSELWEIMERETVRIKALQEHGVSCTAPEILASLEAFMQADAEWRPLEREHLTLVERLTPPAD